MPKVSIIIPVYNSEKYLFRCLKSVCNQTLSDIEIICINDCSTDNSLNILKMYSQKDNRVKLIDFKENKGASAARNKGLEAAEGEYVSFIDSDDFYNLNFLENLYSNAIKNNADIAKGAYYHFNEKTYDKRINEKIDEEKTNFVCDYCSCIFKKDMLTNNNIQFPLLCDMEDPVFAFSCAVCSSKIITVPETYINIFHHTDSQTSKPITLDRVNDRIKGLTIILDKANSIDISKESYSYIFALWLPNIFYNLDALKFSDRIYLKDEVIKFVNKIKYKKEFLDALKERSNSLYSIFYYQEYDNLIFVDKDLKIELLMHYNNEYKMVLDIKKEKEERYFNNFILPRLKESHNDDIYMISVVNDYELYKKIFLDNPFIIHSNTIKLVNFDNTKENTFIAKRYNSFLNNYDYSKPSWFIFCHMDWELLDDIASILDTLDKNALYGPIGTAIDYNAESSCFVGHCLECRRDGSGIYQTGEMKTNADLVDTFDCQCLIVHSSLVEKYNLRFDENLEWDLYVEDFCINAKEKYDIKSYAINFECCHWSGYHVTPDSYYNTLEYVNSKYPNSVYRGTCSLIGNIEFGKKYENVSKRSVFQKLRNNLKKGAK